MGVGKGFSRGDDKGEAKVTFFAFFVFLPVSASALRRLEGFCGGRGAGVGVFCGTGGADGVFVAVCAEVVKRLEGGF